MPTLTELINDINQIDLSGSSGVDVNWPRVVRAMQGLLAVYQGIERSGTIPNDHTTSFMFGDGTTRKLRRIVYLQASQTVKIQKNTGSDAVPVWADLLSVDSSGNLTVTSLVGTLPAHISTHLPGASDPIPTAAPVDIGSANAAGSGTNLSLANHVHKGLHSIDKDSSGSPFYGDLNLLSSTRVTLASGAGTITFNFASPNRTYITTKSLGDQTPATTANTKNAVTSMSNLSIPGADGVKNYKVEAVLNVTSAAITTFDNITINIHLGTAGNTTDTVFFASSVNPDIATGTKFVTLVCNGLRITPTSSQKLTVSVEWTNVSTHVIQHSDPKYCVLRIEEEL